MLQLPIHVEKATNMPRYFWHPSVVYLEAGLGGHKWWMAQTPFPPCQIEPYRDRFEIPCIHYSDDGINWKTISNNPIEELTKKHIKEHDYFSDPHMIYKDGQLELYYRFTILKNKQPIGNKTIIYKRTSIDGFNWSPRTQIADLRTQKDVAVWGEQIISPAVVWNNKEYLCYYVDSSKYIVERNIRVATSKDGIKWNDSLVCEIIGIEVIPWHIDVQYFGGLYRLVLYSDKKNNVTYYESSDGIKFTYKQTVLSLSKSPFSFFCSELYRSCLVNGPNKRISIFFCGANYHNMRSYIGRIDTNDMLKWSFHGKISYWYAYDIAIMFVNKIRKKIKKILTSK